MFRILTSCVLLSVFFSMSNCDCDKKKSVNSTELTSPPPGCLANQAQSVGWQGTLGTTFGDATFDSKFNSEVVIQRQFYYSAAPSTIVWAWQDSPQDKNAYSFPNGSIWFGIYFSQYLLSFGELAVAGFLAHEWAHQVQFKFGWTNLGNPIVELEADAFGGFYLGLVKYSTWSAYQSYFATVYNGGNFNFNDPQFHGTPNQRLASAYLGFNTAIYVVQNQQPLTWNQLHEIFVSGIVGGIAPLSSSSDAARTNFADDLGLSREIARFIDGLELSQIAEGKSVGKDVEIGDTSSMIDSRHFWPIR